MSAFIVGKATIDALVTAIHSITVSRDAPVSAHDLDKIGALLWNENHRSCNALYREHNKAPRYAFEVRACSATEMLKIARCYLYQSCEHEGWATSAACAWIAAIELHAKNLGARQSGAEYEAAPWGIE